MARHELGEENIRKIQVTGREGGSYMITLPKEYIEQLGWREDQKVVVNLDQANNQLTVKDWTE